MDKGRSTVGEDRIGNGIELSSDLVQKSLGEIFQSAPFRSSKQSQDLLRYIVDQTLTGHGELLKERLIGVNVFGRPLDYDTNGDPIVRARAAEVRKRLAQFYVGEGNHSSVRIEIAPGSYHASFTGLPSRVFPTTPPATPVQPELHPSDERSSSQALPVAVRGNTDAIWRKRVAGLAVLAISAVAGLAALFSFLARPTAPIDVFWKPFVDASHPVIIYSGANAVYMLSADFMNRYKSTHHVDALESEGREFAVPISPGMSLGPDDLVALANDFVTIGDMSANVRVSSLLAMHRQRFDLRSGEDIAFSDLRQSPAVLIGAFNNRWTMELTGDLPFVFRHGQSMTLGERVSRGQTWTPTISSDNKILIDYAVVTRIPQSKTGQALIAIAGITQAGTRAAADFITDAQQVKKLAAVGPKDWAQRNLQFVLKTTVVNSIPTSPVIVVTKYW